MVSYHSQQRSTTRLLYIGIADGWTDFSSSPDTLTTLRLCATANALLPLLPCFHFLLSPLTLAETCSVCTLALTIFFPDLLHALNSLHHDRCCRTPTVANGGDAILSMLQLMQQRGENSGTRTSEGVSERNCATEEIDICVLQTEDL